MLDHPSVADGYVVKRNVPEIEGFGIPSCRSRLRKLAPPDRLIARSRRMRVGLADWKGDVLVDSSQQPWLKKIPFSMSAECPINQLEERKLSYSKLLLTGLMEQEASSFQRMITGGDLWFFFSYRCDSVWVASRDELPQRIM
jgi:hypothetical protein